MAALEVRLEPVCQALRLLPALIAPNAASERRRLTYELERGGHPVPQWAPTARKSTGVSFRELDQLRCRAADLPAAELWLARIEELELDLSLLGVLGDPRRVRPLAARRFGTGAVQVQVSGRRMPLSELARRVLDRLAPQTEERTLPAQAPQGVPSLAALMRGVAARAGLQVQVEIEPRLAAGAATGDRTVYLADRRFGIREAGRLAVHEVLGHLTAAANGRAQLIRLLELGTAGSFADQEGLALHLEDAYGLMDDARMRTLAARVVAADRMHSGASFGETARLLLDQEGLCPADAVAVAERAYRGGGVARDVGYLLGWLRVHRALDAGETTVDELRSGRVSLDALAGLRELAKEGLVCAPRYQPNFSRSFCSTSGGTTPFRSPPNAATSLMRLELT